MANVEIARGTLKIPAVGTGKDGQACQTTRDFALIDQDQSDNAVASYLFDPATGQTAQATAANVAAMTSATVEQNGSDNGLLDKFVDPALGCTPFTAPNPTNPAGPSSSQALNELSARQNQKGTIALLPVNNPQLLVGGQFSLGKTNTYRMETDQPLLPRNTNLDRNAAQYCQDMINIATPRLKLDAQFETDTASPVPDLGNNLADFLAARLSGSFDNLNCKNYGLTNPVTLTTDDDGVATGATFNTTPQKASVNAVGGNGAPSPPWCRGRPECHGGGAVLPGDLLVFDAQGPWRKCVFGAATRQEHAGQSHRASAMGQHHQVHRLPVLSRARHDRDPDHPQELGEFRHLRGGLGAPHPVRAGRDADDHRDRPARCAARVQTVRRLDRPDRGRRTAVCAAAAPAGHRAQRRHHPVGLGRPEGLPPRRDLDRPAQSHGQRQRPDLRGLGGEHRFHPDARPGAQHRHGSETPGPRSEDAVLEGRSDGPVAVLGRGADLGRADQQRTTR